MNSLSFSMAYILFAAWSLPVWSSPIEDAGIENGDPMVSESSSDNPLVNYLLELRKSYVDDDWHLVNSSDLSPTSVFCLPDYDVEMSLVREAISDMPSLSCTSSKCSSINRFFFDWSSGNDNRSFPIYKVRVNVYKEVVDRYVPNGQKVRVNVSAYVHLDGALGPSDYSHNLSFSCDKEWIAVDSIEVEALMDSWLEIDLTNIMSDIWDPRLTSSLIEVGLKFDVDCSRQDRVPLRIVNPATIDIVKHQAKRERKNKWQPFLVIFVDDLKVKKSYEEWKKELAVNEFSLETGRDARRRKKRLTPNEACQMQDYVVYFNKIDLDYVKYPRSLKVRQCIGDCYYDELILTPSIAPNHALLMSINYKLFHDHNLQDPNFIHHGIKPENPCCVPVDYNAVYLLVQINSIYEFRMYTDLVVEKCGCH